MPMWYHKTDSLRWLTGSIRQDLMPDERSVWADLMAMASLTREPRRGYIERSEGIPYEKSYLLTFLNISGDLFDRAIAKCIKEGRLQVMPDGTMLLTNWARYNDTTDYKTRKEAKASAIEKSRATNRRKDAVLDRIYQIVNRFNLLDKRYQFEVIEGKIIDKTTGEVKTVEELESLRDKIK